MRKRIWYKRCLFLFLFAVVCIEGHAELKAESPLSVYRTLSTGTAPSYPAIADVNSDSLPDLLVSDQENNVMYVFLQSDSAGLVPAPGSPYPAGHSPGQIAVGSFNRDGYIDCAIANHDRNQVTILLGDNEGRFRESQMSPIPVDNDPHTHSVNCAQIADDGIMDLIVDSPNDHAVIVLLGDGASGFDPTDEMVAVDGKPYRTFSVGDVNGDGHTDIITPNVNNVTVLLGDGQGSFTPSDSSPFVVSQPFATALGDVNGDGHVDIATGGGEGAAVTTVLIGDGTGAFIPAPGSPYTSGTGASSVAIGDVNGDGIHDVCASAWNSGDVTVLLGGADKLTPADGSPFGTGENAYGIAAGDLTGDGIADIAVANQGDGTVVILTSD